MQQLIVVVPSLKLKRCHRLHQHMMMCRKALIASIYHLPFLDILYRRRVMRYAAVGCRGTVAEVEELS